MMTIKKQKTKSLITKNNGRSSDAVSPNFILGCKLGKRSQKESPCSYCYVDRWSREKVYINQNTTEILQSIDNWVQNKEFPKTQNQVHSNLYGIDIGCNTDVHKYWNDYNWLRVFDWFKNHPKCFATYATKFVNTKVLKYNANKKIRCRMSLLPQNLADILEKGTSPIQKRIDFIPKLLNSNFECHINLSPIVVYGGKRWREDYKKLFSQIAKLPNDVLKELKLECIFLTHHVGQHYKNIEQGKVEAEELLWKPELQETKTSIFGGKNIRYKYEMKYKMIDIFKDILKEELDLEIRYIF